MDDLCVKAVFQVLGMQLHPGPPASSPAQLRAFGQDRAKHDLFLTQAHVRRVYERVRHTDELHLTRVVRMRLLGVTVIRA